MWIKRFKITKIITLPKLVSMKLTLIRNPGSPFVVRNKLFLGVMEIQSTRTVKATMNKTSTKLEDFFTTCFQDLP